MNKTPLAIVLMATLSACGGGGSSSDNSGAKASLTFTPVQHVAALVGTQSATLTATRASTSWNPISSAYADDVSTTVELVATDVGGNQFKTNFLDEEGNPASETVTPTGLVRLDDDHAMVELFVMTNKATNLHEYRHYLVEYSTGKMILVETLASIANAWNVLASYYAAGPNSLHNATGDIIYRKEDTKWYKVTPDWANLTFTETYYANTTGNDQYDINWILPAANGDVYTVDVPAGKASLNGTDLGIKNPTSLFQKDGVVYVSNLQGIFTVTNGTVEEVAAINTGILSTAPVISFDGTTINTKDCSTVSLNGNTLEYTYVPADSASISYEAVMAGDDMMCVGQPPVTTSQASKSVAKVASFRSADDFSGNDAACDYVEAWKQKGGIQLLRVSNNSEQRVTGVEGVSKIVPISREAAYMNQIICTATGGDGVSSAKWELTYADTKVDFSTGEISALSAPVIMSIVN
jgi:hypothetical protein